MDKLMALVVLAALIFTIYVLLSRARTTKALGAMPFRKKDYLLTEAERSFYEVLCRSVDRDTVVFPKVRLVDLLWLPRGTPNRQGLLNRVFSKHVDFVLCTGQLLRPLSVVELDDASHSQERRQARDDIVDTILRNADLPLLRVTVRRTYSTEELRQMISFKRGSPDVERPVIEVRRMDGSDNVSA